MNMNDQTRRCANCGAELPGNVIGDRCPKCLLRLGLSTAEAAPLKSPPPASPHPAGLPEPGDRFGHYQIIRRLGEGGMGTVYEAEDIENGRRVALKVLSHSLDSPEGRRRFFREGRLAASVNHPNSVYVFGTEEIAGTPAIAMELVLGGTLEERVAERGPLPVGEAVDCILQAIGGLEAAQQIGILHRDIKPSNCFVDADGAVKIGDFGLSLSTAVRTESSLTVEGAYLGTPAFSAPEQLRGEELTVRSDIYAVGVTLFYLLTARMPFESKHMVQLLAKVLEDRAESPAKYRRGIPKGLCAAVLRCLEKNAGARFKDYAELRAALLPYASTAPTPATLGRRALAGVVDVGVWAMCGLFIFTTAMMLTGGDWTAWQHSPLLPVQSVVTFLLAILYYAAPEGLRGATLGKWICGLRVAGPDRSAPGLARAFLRAAVYLVLPVLPMWISVGFDPAKFMDPGKNSLVLGMSFTNYIVLALLFSTMRRRNGFAAIHDLLTKTRVIRKPAYQARPALIASETAPPVTDALPKIGPYHVLETMEKTDGEEWLLAYDVRLLRKVWLHLVPPGAPPVAAPCRAIGRVGRLRWITGRRSERENWDAFEGVTGKPLVNLLDKPQPWIQVRYWLLDLAAEIAETEKGGTSPAALGLDRVWITAEGRAKLFDFRAPGAAASSGPPPLSANAFLNEVARAALGGGKDLGVPMPLHARKFMETLPKLPSAEAIAGALRPLLQNLAVVTRARRALLVAGCLAVPVLMASIAAIGTRIMDRWQRSQPDLAELKHLLDQRMAMRMAIWPESRPKVDDRLFAIYIAGRYRTAISDSGVWHGYIANILVAGESRLFAEKSLEDHPDPTAGEVAEAAEALKKYISRAEAKAAESRIHDTVWFPLAMFGGFLFLFVCIPSMMTALLFRGGPVVRLCGVAVVRKDGRPASRGRVFWRSIVAWSPVLFGPILFAVLIPLGRAAMEDDVSAPQLVPIPAPVREEPARSEGAAETAPAAAGAPAPPAPVAVGLTESESRVMSVCSLLLSLMIGSLVAWSLALPDRSLQDRIAGTCLVPR